MRLREGHPVGLLVLFLATAATAACAASGDVTESDAGREFDGAFEDGAPGDGGFDSGHDSGPPASDAAVEPGDGGPGGLICTVCATDADCGTGAYCIELAAGGMVCLRSCNAEIPDCPARFDCLNSLLTPAPGPVCTPVGERCCVDGDADDHGIGVGCRGTDCDDSTASTYMGAPETCNDVDDNCDGTVDEDNPGGGVVCSTGLSGACSAGSTTCTAGVVICTPASSTMAEICDGIDNDCDSMVDEDDAGLALTQSCYDGPAGTSGIGGCTAGVRTCAGGMFRGCVGQVLPGTETCNGDDDDCDGMIDDGDPGGGFACITAIPGICAPGTTHCTSGTVTCVGTILPGSRPELCDSLDNDCDGMLNEGFPGLGGACTAGLGTCRRGGVTVCDPASSSGPPICDAVPGTPGPEVCNYLDDDCNGTVDDAFVDAMGRYSTDTNCAACGIDCVAIYSYPGTFGTCSVAGGSPRCVLGCLAGSFNLNGIPDDGCEFTLDATGVYVSGEDPGAVDNATCGLGPVATGGGRHPCRTIAYGIGRASTLGRSRVLVADALYTENVTLLDGVSLLGGYRADVWERHLTTTLTTIRGTSAGGHRRTITATGITMATLVEGFVIDGADASSAGANSYAVHVDGGTSALTFRSNVIYAGNGAPGTAGAPGADGSDGLPGSPGGAAFDTSSSACAVPRSGPSGGARSCGGAVVNGGGGGGVICPTFWDNSPPYSTGSSRRGAAGSGSGAGFGGAAAFDGQTRPAEGCLTCYLPPGGGTMTGGNGTSGGNGGNGAGGTGAVSGTGSVVGSHWAGNAGGAGATALNGGGGGGGGSGGGGDGTGGACTDDLGATGGGGGSGACAGTLGGAGSAGGGSFGIFIVNTTSRPVLTGNTIYRAFGGVGGNGGRGGAGGAGGAGAPGGLKSTANPSFCTGDGGHGGDGGSGGHGGGGGGGAGGVSYAIYASGTTGYGAATSTFPASGGSGTGGSGGPSIGASGTAGATGASANTN